MQYQQSYNFRQKRDFYSPFEIAKSHYSATEFSPLALDIETQNLITSKFN